MGIRGSLEVNEEERCAGKNQPFNRYLQFNIDSTNEILCRLEFRQSDISKLTETSKKILFIIQGNGKTSIDYLLSAKKLIVNLSQYYNFEVVNEFDYTGEN